MPLESKFESKAWAKSPPGPSNDIQITCPVGMSAKLKTAQKKKELVIELISDAIYVKLSTPNFDVGFCRLNKSESQRGHFLP